MKEETSIKFEATVDIVLTTEEIIRANLITSGNVENNTITVHRTVVLDNGKLVIYRHTYKNFRNEITHYERVAFIDNTNRVRWDNITEDGLLS